MDDVGSAAHDRRGRDARCWSCDHPVAPEDRYCAHCSQGQGAFLRWYYRPFWIAVLALTALGPFVLPLVWRTPRLDRTGKLIATLLVLAITGYIGWQLSIGVSELKRALEVLIPRSVPSVFT
jgi:hypothetical protein